MRETNDEYYDPYRYLDFECYNDSEVLEICGVCLKLRATSNLWVRPDEHILSFFMSLKKCHELTICWSCLEEIYSGKIKL